MNVHYISPSTLPSRSANSVHVVWQCDALAKSGGRVTLYAKRAVENAGSLPDAVASTYGIDAAALTFVTFFSERSLADNVRIAVLAASYLRGRPSDELIVCRNLYAAFMLGVLRRRPLIFETHQLERGVRKAMQGLVMTRRWITTVVISQNLADRLARHHGIAPNRTLVLPDAAPDGVVPIDPSRRRAVLRQLASIPAGDWQCVCGYFGHLYSGRGMEILEVLAERRPDILFLAYGGNEADVAQKRGASRWPNLMFMGHVPHSTAIRLMTAMDVLLMPYQRHVSIGVPGHDTAEWMSPMKMFEYLAAGVPIVASRLSALAEVLDDGRNCLMAEPDRPAEWSAAIDQILSNRTLADRLSREAHADYSSKYTWTRRADALIAAARSL